MRLRRRWTASFQLNEMRFQSLEQTCWGSSQIGDLALVDAHGLGHPQEFRHFVQAGLKISFLLTNYDSFSKFECQNPIQE